MDKKTKDTLTKEYQEQAKKTEWCDLAYLIIVLELAIANEKKAKVLKILKLKLKIFEEEKSSRVFSNFNMHRFLSKEYEEVDEFTFE